MPMLSSYARVTGVECYYLNFTDSKEAMELAGREKRDGAAIDLRPGDADAQDHAA